MHVPPELCAIVVTPAGFEEVRATIESLSRQGAERIELVVVAPAERADLRADRPELAGFARVELVAAGPFPSTGWAVAAGVARAEAPLVVYVEEHVKVEPGWADRLVGAGAEWAAVGPTLTNANPRTAVSWASLLTDFGVWLGHSAPVEMDRLPPHQTCYRRDVLGAYGDRLAELLEVESALHALLVADGHRLLLEPRAVVRHLNPSRLGAYLSAELHGGRLFAATRASSEGWPGRRRALYVAASPLIPLVRLRRSLGDLRRARASYRVLPPLVAGLVAHTAGECAGYACGAGDSVRFRTAIELDRRSALAADDTGAA